MLPFDTSHPSGSSLILRRVNSLSQAAFNSLTMQIYVDGAAKVHVPLGQITIQNLTASGITNSRVIETIIGIQNVDRNTGLFRYVNAGNGALACGLLTSFYLDWLREKGWKSQVWFRVSLSNIWRLVPVFNSEKWNDMVSKAGLPISLVDSVSFPSLDSEPYVVDFHSSSAVAVFIASCVGSCLGIPAGSRFVEMFIDEMQFRSIDSL